ncbi:MAG: hypothetical protein HYU64_14900 [Armatimonadetes bacterium]|nr:hypothetical protein [Armatimonadota bacterium]
MRYLRGFTCQALKGGMPFNQANPLGWDGMGDSPGGGVPMGDELKPLLPPRCPPRGSVATPAGGGDPGNQLRSTEGPALRVKRDGNLLNAAQAKKDGTPIPGDGVRLSELGQHLQPGLTPPEPESQIALGTGQTPQGNYFVNLSNDDNDVNITVHQNGEVLVRDANGDIVHQGYMDPDGMLAVAGQGGNDHITVNNQGEAGILIYGGPGDDLISSNGSTRGYVLLDGGEGHDAHAFNGDPWYRAGGSEGHLENFEDHLPLAPWNG